MTGTAFFLAQPRRRGWIDQPCAANVFGPSRHRNRWDCATRFESHRLVVQGGSNRWAQCGRHSHNGHREDLYKIDQKNFQIPWPSLRNCYSGWWHLSKICMSSELLMSYWYTIAFFDWPAGAPFSKRSLGKSLVPIYWNHLMFAQDLCHGQIEYLSLRLVDPTARRGILSILLEKTERSDTTNSQ